MDVKDVWVTLKFKNINIWPFSITIDAGFRLHLNSAIAEDAGDTRHQV